MSEEELEALRQQLDELDDQFVELVARRQQAVKRVAWVKARTNLPLRDGLREARQTARLTELARTRGLDELFIVKLFRELVDYSVRTQEVQLGAAARDETGRPLTVVFQGTEGAFSHIAGRKFFGPRGVAVTYRGLTTFRAMLEDVRAGAADYAMLPIENTTSGSVHDAYDALSHTDLAIVGEEVLRIELCLIGIADVPLETIERGVLPPPGALAVDGVSVVDSARDRRVVHGHGHERGARETRAEFSACLHCQRRGGDDSRAAHPASRHRESSRELHPISRRSRARRSRGIRASRARRP